ncbi:hypothetical protein Verru16b_01937 [Lacunisphaera limnophila]|uniref:Oxaloacetate decarboxylase, gamma chain n=1 Tax=Lacunisphaera limnophila TaxID=1838286 RepID=A0A1D8AVE3_9BACT|nr:hypothetical protein [Lacunisphaera limnophila]AOS44868.1 hypothetical protein Verru16b_01937 [Lacunisphaera limnophila]
MSGFLHLPLAETAGFPWLNLIWVLVSITVLMFAVAGLGRWLAATHPDPVPRVRPKPVVVAEPELTPEIQAAIAAAVYVTLGASARVTSVVLQPASGDNVMLPWSLEGRRQIYTSHKVR